MSAAPGALPFLRGVGRQFFGVVQDCGQRGAGSAVGIGHFDAQRGLLVLDDHPFFMIEAQPRAGA